MDEPQYPNEAGLIAAAQAGDALAEILRFLREGPAFSQHPFGEVEPVSKLAEAALLIGRIEIESYDGPSWAEERQMLNQFLGACERFIEGWAG